MKTVRCFLAVNLELKMANQISELQQTLIRETADMQSKFRWVPPQNMHVTVRFLGNITEPMIQAIKDGLENVTQEAVPFQLEAGPLRVFDPDSPRILNCEIINPDGEFTRLVSAIHTVLENTGFKEIEKPYVPHVTLARIDSGVPDEIRQLLETHHGPADCVSQVRTLVCYQSNLQKPGVDYHLLWKLPFEKRNHPKLNLSEIDMEEELHTEKPDVSSDPQEDSDTVSDPQGDNGDSDTPKDNVETTVETGQGEQEQ